MLLCDFWRKLLNVLHSMNELSAEIRCSPMPYLIETGDCLQGSLLM